MCVLWGARALCNELTAEAGAPVFARKVESLKKQRFTRRSVSSCRSHMPLYTGARALMRRAVVVAVVSEFERLVAAYELKMKAAEKEGRQPQPKVGACSPLHHRIEFVFSCRHGSEPAD